ncbi:family 20 glycosylhydrolase [Lysobacter yananisis]|uniref:beta-N-acetylhexosaminidase n=1 Tax=Lysobacter yananisis TaxID=1003114 RepID=A0ABY9P5S6_9GAMM|nr:family 20 glycosylhydrolase [Lysobacter yananisis]WMT02390.1 family 20 glycosylhydrolase [Lysobacter yananisis]
MNRLFANSRTLARLTRARLPLALFGLVGAAIGLGPAANAAEPVPAAQTAAPELVPLPANVQWGEGAFALDAATTIYANNAEARAVAQLLRDELAATQGLQLALRSGAPKPRKHEDEPAQYVQFVAEPAGRDARANERYRLDIGPRGIRVAGAPAGLFYGYQTLRQLLPAVRGGAPLRLRALSVEDAPRFAYRGMHLDVGRHLFPLDFIKRYLDQMARYKLNTFHWHLTDDQGWRLEIKRYPKLVGVGSKRKQTVVGRNIDPFVGDGTPYGGFYTQEQAREIVAYARARHITVIPEIEMPGHALAALAAYPELACTPGPFEVGANWGVYDDIFCPKEATFKFLENVLDEVVAIFPAPYVHIGGDEAPKTRWTASADAQAVIRREGLKDEHELQSYFIRRIEKFLHTRGKRIIGWDEILEGGLAPDATVMSWRGEAGGIAAAQQGHDVVMTPTQCCYFDYGQGPAAQEQWGLGGELSMDKVYAYDPVPAALTAAQARHVLGVQGNVWTEHLKTPAMVEYMAFPRLLALAEVAWTPQAQRAWPDFQRRLRGQFAHLDRDRVGYRIPAPQGLEDVLLIQQGRERRRSHTVTLAPAVPGAAIRYTLDGRDPDDASPLYSAPIELVLELDKPVQLRTVSVLADGRRSGVQAATLRYRSYLPATAKPARTAAGWSYRVYEGLFANLDEFAAAARQRPAAQGAADTLALERFGRRSRFGVRFDGYVRVPADGAYRFALQGDDRSALYVDGEAVVRNDTHDRTLETSVPLRAGWHRLRLDWYQREGGMSLGLRMAAPDAQGQPGEWKTLDAGAVAH